MNGIYLLNVHIAIVEMRWIIGLFASFLCWLKLFINHIHLQVGLSCLDQDMSITRKSFLNYLFFILCIDLFVVKRLLGQCTIKLKDCVKTKSMQVSQRLQDAKGQPSEVKSAVSCKACTHSTPEHWLLIRTDNWLIDWFDQLYI